MRPSASRTDRTPDPRTQGDGSPEPVYTVDLPEYGVRLRMTVQHATCFALADEGEMLEAGYGHGV